MFKIVNQDDTSIIQCYTYSFSKAFQLALLISQATGVPLAIIRDGSILWTSRDGMTNAA